MPHPLAHLEPLEPRDMPATGLTPNELFITQLYRDFLYREPDAAGLAFHVSRLNAGESPEAVVLGILNSDESLSKFVASQYEKYLGRAASDQELVPWVSFLRAGGSFDNLKAAIISSDEAFTHAGGTNETWLEAAFQLTLGRAADETGRTTFLAQLASGTSRFDIAFGLLRSEEGDKFTARHFYIDYLRRGPDPEGFPGWWMALNQGATDQTVTASFLSSPEFLQGALNDRFRGVIGLIW